MMIIKQSIQQTNFRQVISGAVRKHVYLSKSWMQFS